MHGQIHLVNQVPCGTSKKVVIQKEFYLVCKKELALGCRFDLYYEVWQFDIVCEWLKI